MKKIVAISDVHVKYPGDDADRLLHKFLNHPEVLSADYVLLLGDIFDLMCGPHKEYLDLFGHHFSNLNHLVNLKKKVYFFEGNHDVHLELLFKKIWPNKEVTLSQSPVVESIDGKTYYFSHGDEHEVDNHSYQKYIRLIRSRPLKFIADNLMPYSILKFIGEKASRTSRKKGASKFDAEKVKERFRSGVLAKTKCQFDFVLGGHSHVKDEYRLNNSSSLYVNNGYALHSQTFILIQNHQLQFVQL